MSPPCEDDRSIAETDMRISLTSDVSSEFRRLASLWREQTGHMSSAARLAKHPAYQQIVEMGWAVVPSILAELRNNPDHWFLALQQITKEDPVPTQSSGNVMAMAQAWVEWDTKQGICLDAVG